MRGDGREVRLREAFINERNVRRKAKELRRRRQRKKFSQSMTIQRMRSTFVTSSQRKKYLDMKIMGGVEGRVGLKRGKEAKRLRRGARLRKKERITKEE